MGGITKQEMPSMLGDDDSKRKHQSAALGGSRDFSFVTLKDSRIAIIQLCSSVIAIMTCWVFTEMGQAMLK